MGRHDGGGGATSRLRRVQEGKGCGGRVRINMVDEEQSTIMTFGFITDFGT